MSLDGLETTRGGLLHALATLISSGMDSGPLSEHKVVHDSVLGGVRLEGVFLSLLEVPELQRLHSIHQLGLAYLVYPGANHTRFEHSLGTFHIAKRICKSLQVDKEEERLIECAALLHDVGHLPYSHTLEFELHDQFGIDHAELSRRLIRGEDSVLTASERKILGKSPTIPEVLEKHGISPKEVAAILDSKVPGPGAQKRLAKFDEQTHFNTRRYMSQIVNGPIDADQLDYLGRDAHYTGVAYGVIDLDRLIETMEIFNGDLVVDRGGLSAVEGMLVARALMFSSVYFHKTVRISELMLSKAVERLGEKEVAKIHVMTDATLLGHLVSKGGYFEEVATLLKYRRLYKKAYAIRSADLDQDGWNHIDSLGSVSKRRSLEEDIARRAGVPPGSVIIDIPSSELTISEPRIGLTDVRISDDGKIRLLPRLSTIAASLQVRRSHEWAAMVACPAKDVSRVSKAAERILVV